MIDRDEARLDELYQEFLYIETDMMLETEKLKKLSEDGRRKQRKENQEIRSLRESLRGQLLECASRIFEWAKRFTENPKGKQILHTIREMVIYRDKYWDCKPKEEKEYQALLIYDGKGLLHYREFYKGRNIRPGKMLTSPEQMVNRLHPYYILSASDAITTGKVWKEVEYAIKWRVNIFDSRKPSVTKALTIKRGYHD